MRIDLFRSGLILLGIFCSISAARGQSSIHGVIADERDKPLQNANILLLRYSDSTLVKGTVSTSAGIYLFENVKNGKYLLSASHIGMDRVYGGLIDINAANMDVNQGVLRLKVSPEQLQHITITAKKPMFEQKIDRMVINVKNSITDAGGTALDVLEKSPGVTVNRQNNTISVNGKNGVVVMINEKISYMPVEALVELLNGISAGNIEKIEIITTPPAKYDAEGNAGYINIVMISNPNTGMNGSYFLTGGYGKKPLGSAGLNFNYRHARTNLFGNYGYDYSGYVQGGSGYTSLTKSAGLVENRTFSSRDASRQVHNARLGIDYQVDSSTVLGALVSGYINHWKMTANNGAAVNLNGVLDSTIRTVDNETNLWHNLMTNLNFQHTFHPGQILYLDANYIYYRDSNPNDYYNQYYKGTSDFVYDEHIQSGKNTPIHFYVFSADYVTTVAKKIKLESGAKLSLSNFTNDVSLLRLHPGGWITDSSLSANYLLKENILAAYTTLSFDIDAKTSLKGGLRYEHTGSNLGTTRVANIVDRKYGQLFPTFYISRKIDDNNSLNFSYSRRITRPTFNDLAPFTIFFDPKTFFTGNPALQPAIANSLQASYIHKQFIVSLSYTYEENTIENFQT